jgi:hypothetical protein
MNFLPTVDLWNVAIDRALRSGQLKLQRGQWVQCGQGRKSRFIGVYGHAIRCTHWQGSAERTREHFQQSCEVSRKHKPWYLSRKV